MNLSKVILLLLIMLPGAKAAVIYNNDLSYDQLVFHINDTIIITSDCEINALFDSNYTGFLINITVKPPIGRKTLIVSDCHGSTSYVINTIFKNEFPISESINYTRPNVTNHYKPFILRSPVGLLSFNFDFSFFINHFINGEHDYKIHPFSNEILNNALAITDGSSSKYEAMSRLAQWVDENIEYDYAQFFFPSFIKHPTDLSILRSGKGICYDFAALLMSLANSIGIDANRITSISMPDSFTPLIEVRLDDITRYHVFTEFYDSEWYTADPMIGLVSSRNGFERAMSNGAIYSGNIELTSQYTSNASIISVNDSGFVQINSAYAKRLVVSYYLNGRIIDYWISDLNHNFVVPVKGLDTLIELRDNSLRKVYDSKRLKL